MVQKKYLNEQLKEFLKNLTENIQVDEIILFGSRVNGNAKKDSDVDLIIVSPDFEEMNFFERVSKMYDYWKIDLPVDFLCYTSKEFEKLKKGITIVSEALKKGVVFQNPVVIKN